MSDDEFPEDGFFVAVHLVTESSDHYNMLLHIESVVDFIQKMELHVSGYLYSISSWWVTSYNDEIDRTLECAIGDAVNIAYREHEEKWMEEMANGQ